MDGTDMNAGLLTRSLMAVRHSVGPLPMPMPGKPFASGSEERWSALVLRPLWPPEDEVERAYHRWLLGHHVAFCVWRRLAEVLTRMSLEGVHEAALDDAAAWFDRYSATFAYAGSCGELLYRTVVRPSMAAAHPAFSGVWARDYTWVQRLLRGLDVPADSSLKRAIKRNRLVHVRVARTLVREGESLFKDTGRRASDGALPVEEDLFDRYFRVDRALVAEEVFVAHAVCRADAVLRDLEKYPVDSRECAQVLDLLPADVTSLVRDIVSAFSSTGTGLAA
jgi:hypothetical protein